MSFNKTLSNYVFVKCNHLLSAIPAIKNIFLFSMVLYVIMFVISTGKLRETKRVMQVVIFIH